MHVDIFKIAILFFKDSELDVIVISLQTYFISCSNDYF